MKSLELNPAQTIHSDGEGKRDAVIVQENRDFDHRKSLSVPEIRTLADIWFRYELTQTPSLLKFLGHINGSRFSASSYFPSVQTEQMAPLGP
jgi:hypothetical protein